MSTSIDRVAPTLRPERRNDGTQSWRDLLFVHWQVPAEALRRLVPPSLELDSYQGKHYVGLVPFAMFGVRPAWLPPLLAMDFLETNVRCYVHHRGQPGVYFFSLDAASRLAVQAARSMWSLPYYYASMSLRREGSRIEYRSTRPQGGAHLNVAYRHAENTAESELGTLEHFLFERYLLYVERSGRLYQGQVYHTPYQVAAAELLSLEQNLLAAAGLESTDPPSLSHYSPGVDVEVFGPWRCD